MGLLNRLKNVAVGAARAKRHGDDGDLVDPAVAAELAALESDPPVPVRPVAVAQAAQAQVTGTEQPDAKPAPPVVKGPGGARSL
ncbi:MAG: hypothetical protein KC613_11540 [Myxococcales bacterium]|nr:hypothetical protein [Myxococcales bacterium]